MGRGLVLPQLNGSDFDDSPCGGSHVEKSRWGMGWRGGEGEER